MNETLGQLDIIIGLVMLGAVAIGTILAVVTTTNSLVGRTSFPSRTRAPAKEEVVSTDDPQCPYGTSVNSVWLAAQAGDMLSALRRKQSEHELTSREHNLRLSLEWFVSEPDPQHQPEPRQAASRSSAPKAQDAS